VVRRVRVQEPHVGLQFNDPAGIVDTGADREVTQHHISTLRILCPIHRITGTAMLFPMAL